MSPEERSLCLVMAALLRRGRLMTTLALVLTVASLVAAFELMLHSRQGVRLGFALIAAAVLVGLVGLTLAARVAFDADLFERLGRGALDLQSLDQALARLRLAPAAKLGRTLEARLPGTKRLIRLQLAALLSQLALLLLFTVVALG